MDHCHTVIDTPIGPLTLVAGPDGLREVRFPNGRALSDADGPARPEHPVLAQAAAELDEYFAGTRQEFDVPLDPQGSSFQLDAWRGLTTIPFAETVSYGEQARRLGLGNDAARAVGAANGQNPLPIVLPCHLVIGSDGSLTGFGGGLDVKRFLLEHEGALLPLG